MVLPLSRPLLISLITFHCFFRNQLGVKITPGASINLHLLYGGMEPDLSFLHAPFSLEEVSLAVFSSPPEKAPVPDGFPMLFYQLFWGTIKEGVMGVFESFFSGALNLDSVNSSWICLIPKKSEISTARDLRPISLAHSLTKLLLKVLAARLQKCVHSLINPLQTAFIKGRHILDNFLCAHFLVHHLQSSRSHAAVLKLDFERAFDHVNWSFLLELLEVRGFGDRWIRWIDGLLSSASSAVLLNGVPGIPFSCERGLRQGDPLSPLLFILCADVLFRMIQAAVDADLLPAVEFGDAKFHSLQFADDLLIFFDGTIESAAVLKVILDGFSASSGLKINFGKSSISPINLSAEQAASLGLLLNCPLKEFHLSYLGLPLSPRKLRKVDFAPLIEKLDCRLAGWKGSLLSRGGRLVLLNSVLSGIPAYFCAVFRLPAWVVAAIDKIRRGVFWRGDKLNNGFHCLVKWGVVCRPKRFGRIGVRQLQATNSALLMKWLWNFFNSPSTPWVQVIRAKHYRFRPPAISGRPPAGCSPIWKDLLRLAPPFFTSVNFSLGDGRSTPFWTARWLGDSAPSYLFPNLSVAAKSKHLPVSTVLRRFSSGWDSAFFHPLTLAGHFEVQQLRASLQFCMLSNSPDSLIWRWNSNGLFSTRNAYSFLVFSGVNDYNSSFLWSVKVPLRVKLFLWLAARNRVLTADVLARRGWFGLSICVLNSSNGENLGHLLFSCAYVLAFWNSFLMRFRSNGVSGTIPSINLATTWGTLRSFVSGPSRKFFDLCFAAACWEIWKERNARLFSNRPSSQAELESRVLHVVNFWANNLN